MKQQDKRSSIEHVEAVIEEVEKLNEVITLTEVLYPSWLSNKVVIKKKMVSGECVSILQVSTKFVRRTAST